MAKPKNTTEPVKQTAKVEGQVKTAASSKKPVIIIGIIVVVACACISIFVLAGALLTQSGGFMNNLFSNNWVNPTVYPSLNPSVSPVNSDVGVINNEAPECSLPKVTFPENAFYIGVPNGWIYEVNDGTVSIMQDGTNTTAAFLYTANLKKDLPVQDFLSKFSEVFNATITAAGGSFSTGDPIVSGNKAEATLQGSLSGVTMSGKLMAEKDGSFITLRSYWAPVASLGEQEATLQEVVACFGRNKILTEDILNNIKENNITSSVSTNRSQSNAGMTDYTGRYFRFKKPNNFNITGETDSGLDLTRSDQNAGFSYAYATGFVGGYNPRSWAEKALPEYSGIYNLQLGNGTQIPSQISGFDVQAFDFTGYLSGTTAVQGKVTVGIINAPYYGIGTQYTSAFWAIQIATPEAWPGVKDTLQALLDSLEIIDVGDTRKNTKLPPNRPMESTGSSVTSSFSNKSSVDDEVYENWAEAMRGYASATDSTGTSHDVPLNSWNPTGPQGAGYYMEHSNGSMELLTPNR